MCYVALFRATSRIIFCLLVYLNRSVDLLLLFEAYLEAEGAKPREDVELVGFQL
ncbi:MAG: hypothetical protein QW212_07125 [Nitrososphaerales archaeon]